MSTIAQSKTKTVNERTQIASLTVNEKQDNAKTWTVNSLEETRFGLVPILITIVACMGGFAAAFGTNTYEVMRLALIVFPTMAVLTLILAVMPMKYIVYVSAVAVAIDVLLLLF